MMWGDDYTDYNTIVETTFVPFWVMQLFRLLSFLSLIICSGAYMYIYVRASVLYIQSFALLFTAFAFYFLFINSGKQKCYQIRCSESRFNVNYDDPEKKQDRWLIGVFLYGISFPLALVTNFMYFFEYRLWFGSKMSKFNYQTLAKDINSMLTAFNDKYLEVDLLKKNYIESWRERVVFLSTILPLICLGIDFCLNRIKIPMRQIGFTVFFCIFYLFITYLGSIQ